MKDMIISISFETPSFYKKFVKSAHQLKILLKETAKYCYLENVTISLNYVVVHATSPSNNVICDPLSVSQICDHMISICCWNVTFYATGMCNF